MLRKKIKRKIYQRMYILYVLNKTKKRLRTLNRNEKAEEKEKGIVCLRMYILYVLDKKNTKKAWRER